MSEILREVGLIYRTLAANSNLEFKAIGLAKGQYLYLVRIVEHPGIINDDLAELVRVDRTSVAKSVKKLMSQGLVRKEVDPVNRKIRRLYATTEGQALYKQVQQEESYSSKEALRGFNEREQAELLAYLQRMNHNLTDNWTAVKKGQPRNY